MADYCTHTFRKVVSTYNWSNGSSVRTYRLRCKCCDFCWSVHYDTKLQKEVEVSRMSDNRPLNNKRLTPAEVRTILLDPRSGAELAKVFGVSHQAVNQVRTGRAYRRLWPELPRKFPEEHYATPAQKAESKRLNCQNCTHWWQKKCGLDVPEAGGTFAEECSFYQVDD